MWDEMSVHKFWFYSNGILGVLNLASGLTISQQPTFSILIGLFCIGVAIYEAYVIKKADTEKN